MLEARSKGKTTDALKSLMKLAPKTAVLERDGNEITVPIEQVQKDDIFLVRPGENIPVDGVVHHRAHVPPDLGVRHGEEGIGAVNKGRRGPQGHQGVHIRYGASQKGGAKAASAGPAVNPEEALADHETPLLKKRLWSSLIFLAVSSCR